MIETIRIKSKKSYLADNTGSTYYDLQKENDNLKTLLKGTTHCYDETELKSFKKKLNDIVEYCRTTQMTFEEFIELERIINR